MTIILWIIIYILKLIISDKNLIGGVYPLKNYNWENLTKDKNGNLINNSIEKILQRKNSSQFKDIISDEDMIQFNLLRYNVNYLNNNLKIFFIKSNQLIIELL